MQASDAPTPISQRNETLLAAQRAQEKVLASARMDAAKKAREAERKEILERAGVSMLEEISLLGQIRAEHDAEKRQIEVRWFREEQKHGRGKYWQGFAVGGMVMGAMIGTGLMFYALGLVGGTLDRAVPMRAQERVADEIRDERARDRREAETPRLEAPPATTD